ncbi:MAG: pilus assembly protein PilM, partial [Candidatus Omnitrophica bacterium]|nr:pilus assembly protein PilM [Candidatus Omnitrophota bacterium]
MKIISLKKGPVKKKKIYGLDMGESGLRIASLSRQGEEFILEDFSFRDFPLREEPIDQATLIQTLQDLKKDIAGEEEIKAVVNLYRTEPILKFLTLPYMAEAELNKTIRYQAQRFIVYNIDKMIIDYAVINTFQEGGLKKVNLALAATTKEVVYKEVEILKNGGIEPVSIGVDCLAQFDLAREKGAFKNDEVVGFIDWGAKKVRLQIIDGGIPRFHRECPAIGSWEINKALKQNFKLSWEEAERIKREFSYSPLEDKDKGDYRKVIEKVMGDTLLEIKRSLDYYIDISP